MRTCANCGTPLVPRKRKCERCGTTTVAARAARSNVPSAAAALAPLPSPSPDTRTHSSRTPPPAVARTSLAADDVAPLRCRHCLRRPAAEVTGRVTVGIVVAHATDVAPGPFCRTCGTARLRTLTNRTLWLGWWAPLAPFSNVRTLWRNRRALRTLRRLPEPADGPLPRYAERPLDPGRPIVLRSGMLALGTMTLAFSTALLLIPLVNYLGPVQLEERCVDLATDQRSLTVVDGCGPPADGRIDEIVTGDRSCAERPDAVVALPEYVNNSRACVRLLQP